MARPRELWGRLLHPGGIQSLWCPPGLSAGPALVNIIIDELTEGSRECAAAMELGRSAGQQEGSAEGLGQAGAMGQGNVVQH